MCNEQGGFGMIYLELLIGFLKVGLFSFGGAYAAIPLIRDVVLSYGWMSEEMLADMIAIAESTPGPIMVNLATYTGSTQAGIAGAAVATLAVVTPSFIIILLVMELLKNILKNRYVQTVMKGLRPCMAGIILAAGVHMIVRECLASDGVNLKALILTGFLAVLYYGCGRYLKKPITPITLIIISAAAGIVLTAI